MIRYSVLSSLLLVFMMSCNKEDVKMGNVYEKDGLEVTFEDFNDSRCPEDVTCFWEGESTVKLLIEGSDSIQFSLSTHPDYNDNIKIYKSYKITLIDILPYPNTSKKYDPSDYYVKVLVEKV